MMRKFALSLCIIVASTMTADAGCFLFFCNHYANHHRHHKRHFPRRPHPIHKTIVVHKIIRKTVIIKEHTKADARQNIPPIEPIK
jgi:hypothetical protein